MHKAIPAGWRSTALGDLVDQCSERAGRGTRPIVLSSTKYHGLVPSGEYFQGRAVYSSDLSNYKLVKRHWFAYATNHLAEGSIGLQDRYEIGCVSPMYTVFKCKDGVDPYFLYHVLKSSRLLVEYELREQASVNRRGAIRFSEFAKISIPVPESWHEQRRIAEILDAADEGINHTARCIAKVRITKWSVWQDLCAHAEASFFRLGQLLLGDPRNGYSPVEAVETTGVFALGLGCLTPDGFVPSQLKPIPARGPAIKRALLSDGDLLISRSNTRELVGMAGRYRNIGSPCIYPDLMMRLRPTKDIRPEFLELSLRSDPLRRQIQAAAQGTSGSMVKISAATVRSLEIKLPPLSEQHQILQAMRPWNEIQANLQLSLDKLRLVKKGLMDDLLTGKVRVGKV